MEQKESTAAGLFRVLRPYLIAVIIGSTIPFIAKLLFNPVVVSGSSMSPTFEGGDILSVNEEFSESDIDYGSIVVFKLKGRKEYIKRVVALPGDTLYIDDFGLLYVNDVKSPYQFGYCNDAGCLEDVLTLNDNEYFCMGDNRNASLDCREFGPVSIDNIQSIVIKKIF